MKLFEQRQVKEALAYSQAGGQALHVWKGSWPDGRKPGCFLDGEPWAHLLDEDQQRLVATARRLGVRCVRIHGKKGRQHVDLCSGPLRRALEECK